MILSAVRRYAYLSTVTLYLNLISPSPDWVLLTDSLLFAYTSPSFNAVVPQAKSIIGRPFFDYLSVQGNPHSNVITQRLLNSYSDEEGNGDVRDLSTCYRIKTHCSFQKVLHLNYATVSAIRFHLQTGHFLPIQPDYAYNQFAVVVSRAGGFILAFLHVKAGEDIHVPWLPC